MIKTRFINDSMITTLARSYNILGNSFSLKNAILSTYRPDDIDNLSKPQLHKLISDILLATYKGEASLKARLVELFINTRVTAAFEIKVNSSRADFLTINGKSKSFEIKSELDNLNKLPKQINDYQEVFDYNYIVIDEKHYAKALNLIPETYGIMVLQGKKLSEERKAGLNSLHNARKQLNLLTKKELNQAFASMNNTIDNIIATRTDEEINTRFKEVLKKRYQKKWSFLVKNKSKINAIDYQFFFQHNIEPDLIYCTH